MGSGPATSKDISKIMEQQAAMKAAEQIAGQSAARFGNSLQFENGNSTSASTMDARRTRDIEEETTLGALRKKYGLS